METDPSEKYNVAADYPEVVEKMAKIKKEYEDNIEPVETRIR